LKSTSYNKKDDDNNINNFNDKSRLRKLKNSIKESEMTPMKMNELKIVFDNKHDNLTITNNINNNQHYDNNFNESNNPQNINCTPDRNSFIKSNNKLTQKVFVNSYTPHELVRSISSKVSPELGYKKN